MVITKSLEEFGKYIFFLRKTFSIPDKWAVYGKRTIQEIIKLGVDSIPLVIVISLFIGAVITIQMQLNVTSPLIPAYSVGLATRDIVLLEFSKFDALSDSCRQGGVEYRIRNRHYACDRAD